MPNSNKMVGHFEGKSRTNCFYQTIDAYVQTLGEAKKTIKAQVNYAVKRKFLWLWAYEKTPDGTLYLTVQLDRSWEHPNFHYVKQVSANRWNHHVVVKSEETATSDWLRQLLAEGYQFSQK